MKKNPHMSMIAIDPPRKHPERRWKCTYCYEVGLLDELRAIACTYVYPPCEYCGQTPECAIDCKGVLDALGRPDVYVVGPTKPIPE